jgi:hypothetical protein
VGVEVIGDLAHHPVDGIAVGAEAIGTDPFELRHHVGDLIGRRLGAVVVPDHDWDVARLTVRHPADAVLVVPRRHPGRLAQIAPFHFHRSTFIPPG